MIPYRENKPIIPCGCAPCRGGGASIGAFVTEMNNLARSLRMVKTRFTAPHGLDAGNSVSTSCTLDMALLGVYSMQNPAFRYIIPPDPAQK